MSIIPDGSDRHHGSWGWIVEMMIAFFIGIGKIGIFGIFIFTDPYFSPFLLEIRIFRILTIDSLIMVCAFCAFPAILTPFLILRWVFTHPESEIPSEPPI